MAKRVITLNENKLKAIIKQALKESRLMNEGSSDGALYGAWEECIEMLGEKEMLNALWSAMSDDEIRSNLKYFDRCYDLNLSYFNGD